MTDVEKPPSTSKTQKAGREYDPPMNREKAKWTDIAMAFFTIVIAGAAILQWREMVGTGQQTDKIIAADERMAKAMEASIDQAKIAFAAANKQAILSQRAWLHVLVQTQPHENGQPFMAGEPLEIRITTKNTGRTPAVNVRSATKRDVAERNARGTFPLPPFTYRNSDYVLEGNMTPDQWNYGDFVKPFTRTDLDRITSQVVRMYVHGRVEYLDVFGAHHWTNFCVFLLPTGAWATCPEHNDMDQNAN